MPHNGDTNTISGVYKTLCCDAEIVIGPGAVFPYCPNHKNLPAQWKQFDDVAPGTYQPNPASKIKPKKSSRPIGSARNRYLRVVFDVIVDKRDIHFILHDSIEGDARFPISIGGPQNGDMVNGFAKPVVHLECIPA